MNWPLAIAIGLLLVSPFIASRVGRYMRDHHDPHNTCAVCAHRRGEADPWKG